MNYGDAYEGYYGSEIVGSWKQILADRLLKFSRGRKLLAIATEKGDRTDRFLAATAAVMAAFDLDTAVGAQLERLGALVDRPRPGGMSDEDYRALIKVQVQIVLASTGSTTTILEIIRLLTGYDPLGYHEVYPMHYVVSALVATEDEDTLMATLERATCAAYGASVLSVRPSRRPLIGAYGPPVVTEGAITSGSTVSFTLTDRPYRMLLLVFTIEGPGEPPTTATLDGEAMTLLEDYEPNASCHIQVWGMLEADLPAAGSYTIVTDGSDNGHGAMIEMCGMSQAFTRDVEQAYNESLSAMVLSGQITSEGIAIGIFASGLAGLTLTIPTWREVVRSDNPPRSMDTYIGIRDVYSTQNLDMQITGSAPWVRAAGMYLAFAVRRPVGPSAFGGYDEAGPNGGVGAYGLSL